MKCSSCGVFLVDGVGGWDLDIRRHDSERCAFALEKDMFCAVCVLVDIGVLFYD
jgi:hypothetical protein